MKKIISWGMMLAAAFTLTNCAKEIENPNEQPETGGYPFEIIASTVDTKTVNDVMSTKWADGDQINLFHAEAGTTDYMNDAAFTLKEGETDKFTGNLAVDGALDPQNEYDWYAFYPYKSQIISPKNEAGWAYIGNKNGITQEGGYGKTAHLASSNCPLYGVKKAVPAADMPSIEMQHLSSVVAINVTNMIDEPLTVTSATFTANEPIVGSFYIDFSETPTYTPSEEQYVSNAATVNVTGGTALGNGESGVLYLVVKPFTAAKDSKLYLSVNGYEKELTMPQDVTFTAGKIKTLNFKYDKAPTPHVTWDLTTASYESATAEKVVWSSEFVNLTLEKGTSSSAANNYLGDSDTKAHTRVYQGHVMTFDPLEKYQIESIEFNVVESSYVDKLTGSVWTNAEVAASGTLVTVIPTDGHKNVSVTIDAATRFTGITVCYSYDKEYVLPTVKLLTVSGQTLEYVQNANFTFDGTVIATYTDDTTLDVTDKVTTSSPDMTTTGTKEVTVSYIEGEKTYTTSYEIEVIEASALSGWIETSFADLKEGDQVVIVGIKSSTHYAMSDDKGTESGPLPVGVTTSGDKLSGDPADNIIWTVGVSGENRIFYADATKKTWLYCTSSNNGVRVGTNEANAFAWDKEYLKHVGTSRYLGIYNTQDWRCYTSHTTTNIASQTFKFYVKVGAGETPEPEQPTLTPRDLAFSYTTATATVGQAFTAPTLSGVTTGVKYSSSNTAVAEVNASTGAVTLVGAGTTTITATAPETEQYEEGTATYTLTVSAAPEGGDDSAESVTVSNTIAKVADANGWKDATKYTTVNLDEIITASVSGGGNTGKYYNNGENWRIYQNETPSLKISAVSGYTIKTVKITYTVSNSGTLTYNNSKIISGTVVNVNADSIAFGVGNTGTATNGQVRVTAIEVVYQKN